MKRTFGRSGSVYGSKKARTKPTLSELTFDKALSEPAEPVPFKPFVAAKWGRSEPARATSGKAVVISSPQTDDFVVGPPSAEQFSRKASGPLKRVPLRKRSSNAPTTASDDTDADTNRDMDVMEQTSPAPVATVGKRRRLVTPRRLPSKPQSTSSTPSTARRGSSSSKRKHTMTYGSSQRSPAIESPAVKKKEAPRRSDSVATLPDVDNASDSADDFVTPARTYGSARSSSGKRRRVSSSVGRRPRSTTPTSGMSSNTTPAMQRIATPTTGSTGSKKRFLLRPSRSKPQTPQTPPPGLNFATEEPCDSQATDIYDSQGPDIEEDSQSRIDRSFKALLSDIESPLRPQPLKRSISSPASTSRRSAAVGYGRSSSSSRPALKRSISSPESRNKSSAKSIRFGAPSPPTLQRRGSSSESVAYAEAQEVFSTRESGKNQQLLDDLDYLLQGMSVTSLAARTQSLMKLAQHCSSSDSRRVMRAHGLIVKVITCLQSTDLDEEYALSTALFLYFACKDKLKPDVQSSVIELLYKICTTDLIQNDQKNVKKMRQRLNKLVKQTLGDAHSEYDATQPKTLAMITLQVLAKIDNAATRQLLREQGVLDHLVDQVARHTEDVLSNGSSQGWNQLSLSLNILQSSLFVDQANQRYVAWYEHGLAVSSLAKLLTNSIPSIGKPSCLSHTRDSTCAAISVLLSLTHNHEELCEKLCDTTLLRLLPTFLFELLGDVGQTLALGAGHDITVLCVSLLTNLVEHNAQCRKIVGEHRNIFDDLIKNFRNLISDNASRSKEEETSHNIVAAYLCLLMGCLVSDNQINQDLFLARADAKTLSDVILHVQEFVLWQRNHIKKDVDMKSMQKVIETLHSLECSAGYAEIEADEVEVAG